MNTADESKLRRHWEFLKQELNVDELVRKFVALGVFTVRDRDTIFATDVTNTNRGDRFLEAVIRGGHRAYQTLCNILMEDRNIPGHQSVIKALEMEEPYDHATPASRQQTAMSIGSSCGSSLSIQMSDGANNDAEIDTHGRMVSARAPWRTEPPDQENTNSSMSSRPASLRDCRPSTPAEAVQLAIERASEGRQGAVDMESLETELIKIAPTIADLFSKIQQQTTTVIASSEEELMKIRDDNDRLRKTNRSLVEKLNSFQQKIIQLQLENKKLREVSDNEKMKQDILEQRSSELENLKERLQEQKRALELKEQELDKQMAKISKVISDNEEQKMKLASLEQLHEEGMREYQEQQQQISDLVQEKERQKEQIKVLEQNQKLSEQLLYRFEERLLQLERPRKTTNSRARFGLSRPWMNGAVERSHHANVKLQPQFPTDFTQNGKGGKGWSF